MHSRGGRQRLVGACAAAGLLTVTALFPAAPAAASTTNAAAAAPTAAAGPSPNAAANVDVGGHGWGHGRGMGQYGALGYALDHGWNSAQILDQFYGGTSATTLPAGSQMTVRLLANDAQSLRVQVDGAAIATIADGGQPVGGSGHALKIDLVGPNAFALSDGPNCNGPWTARPGTLATSQVRVLPAQVSTTSFPFGLNGDIPAAGDWNRDGLATVGVFRNGTWYLRNSNSNGPPDAAFGFGLSGDLPVVGDWNGDGVDSVGVFRNGTFYLRNANNNGPPDAVFGFGLSGDAPVVGDWNGDGFDTPGVRRGTTYYLRNSNSNGPPDFTFAYGTSGGTPIAGHWTGFPGDVVGLYQGSTFQLSDATPPAGVVLLTGSDNPLDQTLQVCGAGTDVRWYRGELRAVSDQGVERTVNALDVDAYVRGVVPRESPASWGALGCDTNPCRGMAALEAQSVAARSYSSAENRYSYAKTCDTTSCQVYAGRRQRIGGTETDLENVLSDRAVSNTAGVVRGTGAGVARTEFSSSTGGFTAGGTFPAVPDDGDDISMNPNHNWATALPVSSIEAYYGMGTLLQLTVSARTPEDGGRRAKTVHLVFSGGTVDSAGSTFQSVFGLKSTWFSFDSTFNPVDTVGVWRNGTFYLRKSNTNGPPDMTFGFGLSGDLAVSGDWNGDGVTTVGVFRNGTWYLRNSNSNGPPDATFGFGLSGDVPVVGDWNGDGVDSVGVFRNGTFYLRNSNSNGAPDATFGFGLSGDLPVAGDWNGDGITTVGVFRNGTWYQRNTNTNGPPDATFGFGLSGDLAAPGDWNGDGVTTPGVFRSGTWYQRNTNTNGAPDATFGFGLSGDRPVAGHWT
jgi:peptidoglycan hydrolase-like amidase